MAEDDLKTLTRFQRALGEYKVLWDDADYADDEELQRVRNRLLRDFAEATRILGLNPSKYRNVIASYAEADEEIVRSGFQTLLDEIQIRKGAIRNNRPTSPREQFIPGVKRAKAGTDASTAASIYGVQVGVVSPVVRIFIVHDGDTAARTKLANFIRALGAEPVIAENEATKGRGISEKVDALLSTCHYAVAIATKQRASTQDGKVMARQNVVDELPRIRQELGNRWMIALENGVGLPTNESASIHEGFVAQSMDRVFEALIRELQGHGMLTLRPSPSQ